MLKVFFCVSVYQTKYVTKSLEYNKMYTTRAWSSFPPSIAYTRCTIQT